MRSILYILLLLATITGCAQKIKPVKIKPERKIHIEIPEPSDLCLHPNGDKLFIVSDDGFLFETDLEGKIIRKANYKGLDCEAVHADENHVYVVEEFSRRIRVFDINNLTLIRTVMLKYDGGRNSGYEAMTYNKAKGKFLLFTEKRPIYLYELDEDLNKVNEIDLSKLSRDVSAATYYDDHLWVLGDEAMTVYKLNPNTYEVLKSWSVPIINPEGLTFDQQGNMLILSDDMQLLYYFKNPEK